MFSIFYKASSRVVEISNVVAVTGCTSGCDNNRLRGVRFLDDCLRPTIESVPTVIRMIVGKSIGIRLLVNVC